MGRFLSEFVLPMLLLKGKWVKLEACFGFSVNAAFHLVELNRKENKGRIGFHASRAVFIKGYMGRTLRFSSQGFMLLIVALCTAQLVTRISHPSWVSFPFLICSSIGLVDWSLTSNFLGLNIILLYVYQLPIEFSDIFLWVAEFIGLFKISAKSEQSEVCYGLSLLLFYVMSWLSSGDASYMSLEWPLIVKVPKLIAFLGFGWTITRFI
uniref:Uncharacterized protein n=1 Tax=Quercus lobata TaxID=97700 RepID=A0A7N2L4K9_QUELO